MTRPRPEIPDTYDGCIDMLADLTVTRWPGCDRDVEREALSGAYPTHGRAANAIAYHELYDHGRAYPHLADEAHQYLTDADRAHLRTGG